MGGYIYLKRGDKRVIKSLDFPSNTNKYNCKNVVILGIGGNIGDTKRVFKRLLVKFRRDRLLNIHTTSIIYKNPPFGYLKQPYFYNSIILASTYLKPLEFLRYTQRVEKYFRRKREFKDSPRTLDLDIIFYNNLKVNKAPKLIIPHPNWSERDSVLIPLKYLKGNRCLKRVLLRQHQLKHIN